MDILKSKLVRYGFQVAKSVARDVAKPPWKPSGHYYSPIPSAKDIGRAIDSVRVPAAIDLREAEQLDLLNSLRITPPPEGRWRADNDMFGPADAAVLQALLLHFRPQNFVEVGSGHSTALVLDLLGQGSIEVKITCVEPYADRLRSRLLPGDAEKIRLIETPVQEVAPEELAAMVSAGDIFFIDSTHVVKAGSDVCHLILHTLPLVPIGTIVHIHDIFWPFEYPADWLASGRSWTEDYLLQAFLMYNDSWDIICFNSWLWASGADAVPASLAREKPGSMWIVKRR